MFSVAISKLMAFSIWQLLLLFRYCGSVHPQTDTPCTHLVVEGNR
jgi:hypothetical protein